MYVKRRSHTPIWQWALASLLLLVGVSTSAWAGQPPADPPPAADTPPPPQAPDKGSLEIYGFAMLDFARTSSRSTRPGSTR